MEDHCFINNLLKHNFYSFYIIEDVEIKFIF